MWLHNNYTARVRWMGWMHTGMHKKAFAFPSTFQYFDFDAIIRFGAELSISYMS